MATRGGSSSVSAVIASYNRSRALKRVLDELALVPEVVEVIVADNGSSDDTLAMLEHRPGVTVIPLGENTGVAARNRAAEVAQGDYLLLLDDDSFPRPDAVATLVGVLDRHPEVAIAGGFVQDVTEAGAVLRDRGPGTFDWFLRGGRRIPADGASAYFFPECAALARRAAYLEVGGYFEPYFHSGTLGLDLATLLYARGYDVRYVPDAVFWHLKSAVRPTQADMTRLRVRNEMWYFLRHFPARRALARMVFYAAFNLVLAAYLRHPGAVLAGIRDAWRGRHEIVATRQVMPRDVLRRAERDRSKLHLRLLAAQLARRLHGDHSSTLRGVPDAEFMLSATVRSGPLQRRTSEQSGAQHESTGASTTPS